MEIGVIPADSIFSPVQRVRYRTENTRVGKMTNYDRLILELWTDGTITPEMALVEASKIYRKHLNPFIQFFDVGQGACGRAARRRRARAPAAIGRHARARATAPAALSAASAGRTTSSAASWSCPSATWTSPSAPATASSPRASRPSGISCRRSAGRAAAPQELRPDLAQGDHEEARRHGASTWAWTSRPSVGGEGIASDATPASRQEAQRPTPSTAWRCAATSRVRCS